MGHMQSGEDMYGHAGMLGAAAAVWEDLRNNHILAALLDLPSDDDCKPHHEAGDDQHYDSRMSRSEKDRHLEWEAGISDAPADMEPSTRSAHDKAESCAKGAQDCRTNGDSRRNLGRADQKSATAERQAEQAAQGAKHRHGDEGSGLSFLPLSVSVMSLCACGLACGLSLRERQAQISHNAIVPTDCTVQYCAIVLRRSAARHRL